MSGRTKPRGRSEEIVAAALACFARKGIAATTIADIRAESRASVGSIYHHFGDKEGIAGRVYLEVLRRYHESYLAALEGCATGEAAVKTTVRHYLRWVLENRDAARLLFEARHVPQVVASEREIRAATKHFLDAAHAKLARFVDSGEILPLPPPVLTAILAAPCSALAAEWLRGGKAREAVSHTEMLATAAWRALRNETTPKATRKTTGRTPA